MVAVAEELESAGEPARSQKVWFDDGNVILQAENVQFRAHRSILSKHSVILASLLDTAQPGGEETVEGCPDTVLRPSNYRVRLHICKPLTGEHLRSMRLFFFFRTTLSRSPAQISSARPAEATISTSRASSPPPQSTPPGLPSPPAAPSTAIHLLQHLTHLTTCSMRGRLRVVVHSTRTRTLYRSYDTSCGKESCRQRYRRS